jgi:hypothetical protein
MPSSPNKCRFKGETKHRKELVISGSLPGQPLHIGTPTDTRTGAASQQRDPSQLATGQFEETIPTVAGCGTTSKLRRSPRRVPEVNDFDGFSPFIDLVVNAYRRVKEASNVPALADHYPEVGKRSKYLAVVKKTFAESGGGVRVIGSDIVQNFPKVA